MIAQRPETFVFLKKENHGSRALIKEEISGVII
jgi:hypothetical protein